MSNAPSEYTVQSDGHSSLQSRSQLGLQENQAASNSSAPAAYTSQLSDTTTSGLDVSRRAIDVLRGQRESLIGMVANLDKQIQDLESDLPAETQLQVNSSLGGPTQNLRSNIALTGGGGEDIHLQGSVVTADCQIARGPYVTPSVESSIQERLSKAPAPAPVSQVGGGSAAVPRRAPEKLAQSHAAIDAATCDRSSEAGSESEGSSPDCEMEADVAIDDRVISDGVTCIKPGCVALPFYGKYKLKEHRRHLASIHGEGDDLTCGMPGCLHPAKHLGRPDNLGRHQARCESYKAHGVLYSRVRLDPMAPWKEMYPDAEQREVIEAEIQARLAKERAQKAKERQVRVQKKREWRATSSTGQSPARSSIYTAENAGTDVA